MDKKQWFIGGAIALMVSGGIVSNALGNKSIADTTAHQRVLAVGSTAMQPLANQAAQRYNAKHPVQNIVVQGGGSSFGLNQVGQNGVTIGNSDMYAERQPGINIQKLQDHKIAVVGIAPVINADINLNSLTMYQLRSIFLGSITNWREVGGPDEKITVINRAAGSGTRYTFEDAVINGDSAMTTEELDDNGAVKQTVATTPGAISYLAFSYLNGQAMQHIKPLTIDGVQPTVNNVKTNAWPIWAYEHMYTTTSPDYATKQFVKFMQSGTMVKSAERLGYIPVRDMQVEKNADGVVTER